MRSLAKFAVVVAALSFLNPAARAADEFKLDSVHSSLVFKVKHMDVSYTWGNIGQPAGKVVWDSADPTKSKIEVTANAANLSTGNAKRNQRLKSPDFFDAKQFPTLSFKSTAIKPAGENKYEVTGDLTIRGTTKPITVTLDHVGTATGERGTKTGFDGSFTINRQDFGVAYGPQAIGNDVVIHVGIEADKQ